MNTNFEKPLRMFCCKTHEFVDAPHSVLNFFSELETLYKKYNISITNEDGEFSRFILNKYQEDDINLLRSAHLDF